MTYLKQLCFIILILGISGIVFGQDKMTLSGGMTLGGEAYTVEGIENRRSPLSYYINGRIALSYKGFSLPLTVSYRDAQFSYDYNFNRIGIAPSYKWVKLYLGWNTMNFSQYTMNGRAFYGVGLTLTPGKFHFSALKGKVQNLLAIRDTLINGANLIPTYERDIFGLKLGVGKNKNKFEMIFMKISDDLESFSYNKEYTSTYGYQVLTPKENLIVGINGAVSVFKMVDLYINSGISAFTADASDTLLLKYGKDVPSFAKDLFQANSSSRVALAGDAGINIRIKSQKFGLKYRRIDPFYTTLASNFFMNDVEQYTINTRLQIWKKKINFDGNVGIEQNNLTKLRTNTTNRVISSAGVSFNPKENFFASFRYTNFQTESENSILQLNDTLRFISTTQEFSTLFNYTINTKVMKTGFSFNAYYNTVQDLSLEQQIGNIQVLSLSTQCALGWVAHDLTLSPSLLFNEYMYSGISQQRLGGGIKIQKRFIDKKLNMTLSGNYSVNTYDGKNDGDLTVLQVNSSYKIDKRNTLNLNSSYRISNSIINRSFNELRIMCRYGINF